ncbi:MAG: oligosaccharide flippase family protein [Flavobacteriales bacterium]|nr:oligosaccharide flippase family protein [Flavobacteriales bacterium]MCX7769277.1 oligosaccharide flippase family protein [Flavobacteriales bacterium]MDW8409992.1 oligosaccharide flippase family protein [Flavobacteriales bacterium]
MKSAQWPLPAEVSSSPDSEASVADFATFRRHATVSIIGTLVAQGLVVAAQPLLRRWYPPEAFGELSLYISVVGVLSVVAPFRYDLALAVPRNRDRAMRLFWGGLMLCTAFSVLVSGTFLLMDDLLIRVLKFPPSARWWLPLTGLSVWAYGFFLLLQSLFSRDHRYMAVNGLKIFRRVPEVILQILGSGLSQAGLLLGELVGRLCSVLWGVWWLRRYEKPKLFRSLVLMDVCKHLWAFRRYPASSFFPTLFNALALLAPGLLVNYHFGVIENGLFDMGLMVVAFPVTFLINSLSNVLLAYLSQLYREKAPMKKFLLRTLRGLGLGVLGLFLVVWTLGPSGFEFLFGPPYRVSAFYALILLPALGSRLMAAPLAVVFAAVNRIHGSVWWQYTYTAAILLFFLLPFRSMETFLWSFSLTETVLNLLYLWHIYGTVNRVEKMYCLKKIYM